MAYVEIWDKYGKTGHASLHIDDESYCSFHPEPRYANLIAEGTTGVPGFFKRRDGDILKHRGGPIDTIFINFLDDEKMINQLNKWIGQAQAGQMTYHLFGDNCSRVVAHLLCIGAGIEWTLLKHINQLASQIDRLPVQPYSSGRITELVQSGVEDYLILSSPRKVLAKSRVVQVLLGLDILSRALVWTPGDVKKLALMLSEHNHLN